MKTYRFHGIVTPEHDALNLVVSTPLDLVNPETGELEIRGTLEIKNANINVTFELTRDFDLPSLRNRAEDFVRLFTNMLAYSWGFGYDCEIIGVYDEKGNHQLLGPSIPVLQASRGERPLTINQLMSIVMTYPLLRLALEDMREAMRSPIDTGFRCYRSIETMRRHFLPAGAEDDGKQKTQSWVDFRSALNIDRSWIDVVKPFSDIRRHGGDRSISDSERANLFVHTWKVADRFVFLLHEKLKQLPIDRFPQLQEPARQEV